MTLLDPPAAAARRQNTLDELAELLTAWGCPTDTARARAQVLLHAVTGHGYALPVALTDAPTLHGTGSTEEGRRRARVIATNTRLGCRCHDRAAPLDQHPATCALHGATDRAHVDAPPLNGGPATGHPDDLPSRDETPGGAR